MFEGLQRRIADMRTLSALCRGAERHANADGQKEPGAEHFVLAALELPDGSADKALQRLGTDPSRFREAISQQYRDALEAVGLGGALPASAPVAPSTGVYRTGASAQTLVQRLAEWPRSSPRERLSGAHVLAVAATADQGVAARAFRSMGVDLDALRTAARAEIDACAQPA